MTYTQHKGFTLVEALMVLFIVSMLAAITLVSLDRSRDKARDAQRKNDMTQVQNGLELYFSTHDQYPAENVCDSSLGSCGTACPCSDTQWDDTNPAYIASKFKAEDIAQELMVDPVNDSTYYYWYEPSCNQGMCVGKGCCAFTIGTRLESDGSVYTLSGSSGL